MPDKWNIYDVTNSRNCVLEEFCSTYREYDIHIQREKNAFYIIVQSENGVAYDGYWGNGQESILDAIVESLISSCLLDDVERLKNA